MRPPSQDPTNPTGQPAPYSQPAQPFMPPPPPLSSSQGSYPAGEEAYYNRISQNEGPITRYQGTQGKLNVPPVAPKPRNGWKVVSLILGVLVLILAIATTALVLTHSTGKQIVQTTPVSTTTQPVLQTTPTATQGSTGTTATPGAGITGPITNYNAPQPGPACDPNGGVWTPYPVGVISNIQCGTSITIGANQTRGYLGLQLPGKTFASTNRIEVTTTLPAIGDTQIDNCVGLVEQDANTGYLAELCNNGQWSIYLIGSSGAVIKTLTSNITAAQSSETLDLTFKGTTLTLTIAGDTEAHTVTLSSPLQPVIVGIAVYHTNANWGQTVDNFSYVTQF